MFKVPFNDVRTELQSNYWAASKSQFMQSIPNNRNEPEETQTFFSIIVFLLYYVCNLFRVSMFNPVGNTIITSKMYFIAVASI